MKEKLLKNKKGHIIHYIIMMVVILLLTGCVSQSDFDKEVARGNQLQTDYDKLFAETANWRKLSEEEKATQLANAEKERIIAETERKKAEEKKAAAEAEAERAAKEASSFTLAMGDYTVGEDIPAGKYDCYAVRGSGNFQGTVVNEILRSGDTYSNLALETGNTISIGGSLVVKFTPN